MTREAWKKWECPKCGDIYDSPIPIFDRYHPCPKDMKRIVHYRPVKARAS